MTNFLYNHIGHIYNLQNSIWNLELIKKNHATFLRRFRRIQGKRVSESVVFNSGQKMALRAFYFLRALTKALTYYYINRSQRHLLVTIENNWFGVKCIKQEKLGFSIEARRPLWDKVHWLWSNFKGFLLKV